MRETPAERIDSYGQVGELFQYPYPLNVREFIVTAAPLGWQNGDRRTGKAKFAIYYVTADGRRELLVSDPKVDCQQAIPLTPRAVPTIRPSVVDYRRSKGYYYVQDVYAGPGLAGVPRGSVKRLRVVALDFRAAGVGSNGSRGPGGGALISTPVAIGNGTWDVKIVLGDATVHADGSAAFEVPARTPVYFQALDENGRAIQTMRSWSTLQPGEVASCVGCHDHKNSAPPVRRMTLAQQRGPQPLIPFYGPARGFSFAKEIQPILDLKCVSCHHESQTLMAGAGWRGKDGVHRKPGDTGTNAFSLSGRTVLDPRAKRHWSEAYLNLTQSSGDRDAWALGSFRGDNEGRVVNWIGSQSVVSQLPPHFAGANRSELIPLLERGHYGVTMNREEMDKLACWIDLLVPFCGDYYEAAAWTTEERQKYDRYQKKRLRMEELERRNIADLLAQER